MLTIFVFVTTDCGVGMNPNTIDTTETSIHGSLLQNPGCGGTIKVPNKLQISLTDHRRKKAEQSCMKPSYG